MLSKPPMPLSVSVKVESMGTDAAGLRTSRDSYDLATADVKSNPESPDLNDSASNSGYFDMRCVVFFLHGCYVCFVFFIKIPCFNAYKDARTIVNIFSELMG